MQEKRRNFKMGLFQKVRQFVIDSFAKIGDTHSLKHFDRTVYWLLKLKPDADEAMQIAAVAHDIERAFKDPRRMEVVKKSDKGFKDDHYLKYHPEKGAEIIGEFLKKEGASQETIERVKKLISKHEVGGNDDENFIKDADSVSYFENNIGHFITRISEEVSKEKIKEKFNWMYDRITSPKAKEIARRWHKEAVERLDQS